MFGWLRRSSAVSVCLLLGLTGCGASGPPATSWSDSDDGSIAVDESGRVTFENIPFYVTSVSCTEPVEWISGEGRSTGDGEIIDVLLDDPIELGPRGDTRQRNLVFIATGPGWDVWREIATGGCDTDAPEARFTRDD